MKEEGRRKKEEGVISLTNDQYCMMLNFVGAGSPTIIAYNLQSHKPAPALIYAVILWPIGVSEIRKTNRRNVNLCLTD